MGSVLANFEICVFLCSCYIEAGALGSPSSCERLTYYYFFRLEKKLIYFGPGGDELLAGRAAATEGRGGWGRSWGRAARWLAAESYRAVLSRRERRGPLCGK